MLNSDLTGLNTVEIVIFAYLDFCEFVIWDFCGIRELSISMIGNTILIILARFLNS